jgi:hypothetical protein
MFEKEIEKYSENVNGDEGDKHESVYKVSPGKQIAGLFAYPYQNPA